jgi:hypothetical protein
MLAPPFRFNRNGVGFLRNILQHYEASPQSFEIFPTACRARQGASDASGNEICKEALSIC